MSLMKCLKILPFLISCQVFSILVRSESDPKDSAAHVVVVVIIVCSTNVVIHIIRIFIVYYCFVVYPLCTLRNHDQLSLSTIL